MTERQKTILWKRTQAKRNRFARQMERVWKKALQEQIQPVLDEISEATVRSVDSRVGDLIREDPVREALEKTLEVVAVYFARTTYQDIKKAAGQEWTIKAGGLPTDREWMGYIDSLMEMAAGERITAITGESKDQAVKVIQESIRRSAQEGLGISQMSQILRDDLNDHWGKISTYRAARIARTETTMASNMGSQMGARQTGEPMMKVWLSTRDSRTRKPKKGNPYDHYGKYPAGPDGEKVELEGVFTKTGEELEYPGDYHGSAGNVINCRCTQFYEPKEDDLAPDETVEPPTGKPPPVRRPKPPKPPRATRRERIKSAKEKLATLEDDGKLKRELSKINRQMKEMEDRFNEFSEIQRKLLRQLPGADDATKATLLAQYNQMKNKVSPLIKELQKLGSKKAELLHKGYGDEVAKILGLGDGSNIKYSYRTGDRVRTRSGVITANGRKRDAEAGLFQEIMGNIDETKHGTEIRIFSSKSNKRAFSYDDTAFVFADSDVATVCHEMAHALEEYSPYIQKKVRDFLELRCKGDKLKVINPGAERLKLEFAWEDKFKNVYTGRFYGQNMTEGMECTRQLLDKSAGTEAFSMWWTELIRNPSQFIKQDPEYFEYFYNMILEMQGVQ